MDKCSDSGGNSADMTSDNHMPRISDVQLRKGLAAIGAVIIIGPKLRVYAQALNGTVYHCRDRNGSECDAVVHLADERWGRSR